MSRTDGSLTSLPDEGRYFGLENCDNNDFCNCILQALYVCIPFRDAVLQYAQSIENRSDHEDNICTCLADLFSQIHNHRKKSGIISPKRFLEELKRRNDQFCKSVSQDAHEFLVYLLLQISAILEKEQNGDQVKRHSHEANVPSEGPNQKDPRSNAHSGKQDLELTWIQEIFEGKLVHETKCLQCETVTSREEVLMDLQIPVKHNSSLTSCLKKYSARTLFYNREKQFCEVCQCHQEAYQQNKLKQLPQILVCHLMRFDDRMRKLMYRVVFPMELKLCNTTDDTPACDDAYNLVAVVVHLGRELVGHFISLVRSHGHWLLFDDDHVEAVSESWVERTFGSPQIDSRKKESAYILFYERIAQREVPN